MGYFTYNKLSENEFDNIISKKHKIQDLNLNKLKLKVNDVYKKTKK